MVYTVKRFAMAVLAFWFAIWSVLLPVTVHAAVYDAASNIAGSKWYVPAAGTGVAGSRVLATAATALGRANPWIAALTIGTPIMKHILETRGDAEVVIAPTADSLPAPAGWPSANNPPPTAPASGMGTPSGQIGDTQAPITTPLWYEQNGAYGPSYSSAQSACDAMAARSYATFWANTAWTLVTPASFTLFASGVSGRCESRVTSGGYYQENISANIYMFQQPSCSEGFTYSGNVCQRTSCPSGAPLLNNGTCYTSPTCPTGYAMNHDTCILAENATNKVKWPVGTNDGARAYIPDPVNSGQWMPHPRESNPLPQGLSDSDIQAGLINAGQTYTKDAYGNPVATTIIPNLSGGYTFNQQVQTTNNNQTTTTTNTYTTNAQGAVTNVSSVTNNGPITNVSNNYTVDIPNDYNKEATQLKIYTGEGAPDAPNHAQTVTQKVTEMNKSITDLLDPIADQYASDKGKWFSWVWTPPVGQCEPITGSVHGKSVNWDLCPYVAKVRDVIGWIFAIFGAWVIYNEMFRREA